MSEDTREAVEFPTTGDVAFGALMDALVTEESAAGVGEGSTPDAADAPAKQDAPDGGADTPGGSPATPGQPATAAVAEDTPAPDDAGGTAAGSTEQPATPGDGTDLPADWTADAASYIPKLGQLSTTIEENLTKGFQQQAFDQAREEYEKYFEALEKHPRLLVGTEVPAIGEDGMERLKDSEDAKEWQEAVRSLLVQEIRDEAQKKLDASRTHLETLHASIDLFKNNPDLIPGTRTFNRQLADKFAEIAKPYEVRDDGKLQGYSVPVQPIIEALRGQMTQQAATVDQSAPPASAPSAGATSTPPVAEPPQAGIPSKAGSSAEKEDFSTLFGTIGLPNLQI